MMVCASAMAVAGIRGDVNSDGKLNVSDVTALVNRILGVVQIDADLADVNGDGRVNVSDVTDLVNRTLMCRWPSGTACSRSMTPIILQSSTSWQTAPPLSKMARRRSSTALV